MHWNFSGDIPIYIQIVHQLEQLIASGTIARGERMPSVRELAMEAGVNPNTMQKAFAELEKRGFVYSRRTAGRFVTDSPERLEELKRTLALRETGEFLEAMKRLGYSPEEAAQLLSERIGENKSEREELFYEQNI